MGLFSRKPKAPEPEEVQEKEVDLDREELHAIRARGVDFTRGIIKKLKRRGYDPAYRSKHKYYAAKKRALEGLL